MVLVHQRWMRDEVDGCAAEVALSLRPTNAYLALVYGEGPCQLQWDLPTGLEAKEAQTVGGRRSTRVGQFRRWECAWPGARLMCLRTPPVPSMCVTNHTDRTWGQSHVPGSRKIYFGVGWGGGLGAPFRNPLCDIPSGCCSFTGPWTVTRSSLRMLRRVATFCRPQRPVLLLVSFPRSRSPVVGVLGLC